jgi:hypothetical protein
MLMAQQQFGRGEEEGDFDGRGFGGVGAVDAVALDGSNGYFTARRILLMADSSIPLGVSWSKENAHQGS